ncbi:hypothetical protein L6452_02722 [Arctium lappa]|uniref:Uncharacterized protein n=1 Tax=Arctium lappa TaxID=4217 RepID=A0ACB9FK64_ARCLA|nr:hypothetical protein L6452_02722 [Arctium lappa]
MINLIEGNGDWRMDSWWSIGDGELEIDWSVVSWWRIGELAMDCGGLMVENRLDGGLTPHGVLLLGRWTVRRNFMKKPCGIRPRKEWVRSRGRPQSAGGGGC